MYKHSKLCSHALYNYFSPIHIENRIKLELTGNKNDHQREDDRIWLHVFWGFLKIFGVSVENSRCKIFKNSLKNTKNFFRFREENFSESLPWHRLYRPIFLRQKINEEPSQDLFYVADCTSGVPNKDSFYKFPRLINFTTLQHVIKANNKNLTTRKTREAIKDVL